MGLDKTCTNFHYLIGRLIAVVEKSNGKPLTPCQFDNIFMNPQTLVLYDKHKMSYDKERHEIIKSMPATGLPDKVNNEESGRMWIGYYHQKSALPEIIVEQHEAERVECVPADNTIEELHK